MQRGPHQPLLARGEQVCAIWFGGDLVPQSCLDDISGVYVEFLYADDIEMQELPYIPVGCNTPDFFDWLDGEVECHGPGPEEY